MRAVTLMLMMFGWLQAAVYFVDQSRSSVAFEATKMFFVGVEGKFKKFQGSFKVEKGRLEFLQGIVTVESIDTDNSTRDSHLKGDGFFDIENFPYMQFHSENIDKNKVQGELTIRGITHKVTLDIISISEQGDSAKIELKGVIDRTKWGIDSSFMSSVIDDEVEIKLSLVGSLR